ncbi:MAG: PEP-CTERM sorting domain-containing protein [Chthoniobacterales bacterium]
MKSVLTLALAVSMLGQEARFDVQSRLVLVPATVTDAKGRAVDGLELADFVVLDEGRTQKVSVDSFGTGVAPIALVIAVQSSGISAPVLAKVQKIGSMTQNDFYDFILYDSVTFDFIAYETFAVGDTASYTVGSNSFTEGQTYTAVLSYYSPNTVIDEDYRSSVSYGSNNMIEFTTVPEPSTVALVVLGGVAGLLGLARRRSARCCATPS